MPSSHDGRSTTTSATSTRPRRGSCYSMPHRRFFRRFPNPAAARCASARTPGRGNSRSARWSPASMSAASTPTRTDPGCGGSRRPRRSGPPASRPPRSDACVVRAAGAEVDRAGRVQVRPDCTLPGHPEIFVIGDLMSLDSLPGLAQVAIQSGRHAAATIVRRLRGDATERRFRYHDLGTMATISRFQRDRDDRTRASVGVRRLVPLARGAPRCADWIQESHRRPRQLARCLPWPRTPAARDHPTAGLRSRPLEAPAAESPAEALPAASIPTAAPASLGKSFHKYDS